VTPPGGTGVAYLFQVSYTRWRHQKPSSVQLRLHLLM